MKKVLIITPNWPPVACPDMHRVRSSLAFLDEFGWEPLILKINPDEQEGVHDTTLEKTIPPGTQVWQAGCFSKSWTRWVGINNVGLRSFFHLAWLGNEIIETMKPDLVFFSTTLFPVMLLGRYWHIRYGVSYVLDFQDPWLNDYYAKVGVKPPGGYFKYLILQTLSKWLESLTLRQTSHVIAVSPEYPKALMHRYSWLHKDQFTVLPFGAPEADFSLLPKLNIRQPIFDPTDGKRHWVYVGRGGSDMALALRSLFTAIQSMRQQNPQQWSQIRLHFVGTSYASGARAEKTVEPIAQEMGIADLVAEYPNRIPYFEAMQTLVDSHAILLIGSDDPGYTASKLYPCVLARKPIFAIFHQQSSVVGILKDCQAGRAVTFNSSNQPTDLVDAIADSLNWLLSLPEQYQPKTNWSAFQPYTAREMTRQQCAVFDQCLTAMREIAA